ncbi:hypothetical protein E3E30_01385 [Thermococcus sp. 9N3]|nr:hypothetical protein [Thermococcus sp. 9N3]
MPRWGRRRGFGRGWRFARWLPWPGRGPFSYLPPWQRPGWAYRWGYGVRRPYLYWYYPYY